MICDDRSLRFECETAPLPGPALPGRDAADPAPLVVTGVVESLTEVPEHSRGQARPAEGQLLERIYAAEVVAALRAPPVAFRTAVYLTDIEGLSYRQTAQIMGSPVGTVMSQLHRARRSLRIALTRSCHMIARGLTGEPVPPGSRSGAIAHRNDQRAAA
jgi:Sigma-70, region 4